MGGNLRISRLNQLEEDFENLEEKQIDWEESRQISIFSQGGNLVIDEEIKFNTVKLFRFWRKLKNIKIQSVGERFRTRRKP